MKKFLGFLYLLLLIVVVYESWYLFRPVPPLKPLPIARPLLIYSFQNLKKTIFPKSSILLGEKVADTQNSFSQMFYYETPSRPNSLVMKKVSGLMNAPLQPGKYPVIVMIRGFVPDNIYAPGIGTEPVAKELAKKGFITLAPDFLGFGQSSPGATDTFENRFQSYTTTLSLLSSLSTLNSALEASYSAALSADTTKIGIWGHSNGGHIALSVLAISGVTYPTVLWAPVSTSFPYSILYYTDESDDQGKILRKILAKFETVYDTDVFSPQNYYSWIKAPLDIEQGTNDHEVPVWWSDTLTDTLTKDNVDVTENTHEGADHNMLPPTTWNAAVENTISFFTSKLK